MNDTTPTTNEAETERDTTDRSPSGGDDGPPSAGADRTRSRLLKGALVLLVLLAVVATLRLYLSASAAIGTWVTHEYRPLVQAAFNLVVLAAAGLGIVAVLRRLTEG